MLPKFSVKKPFTIVVVVILIIVFGIVAFTKMTPDLFPTIDLPYVSVITTYNGAAPEEVEKNVTEPLEKSMGTLDNLKNINSVSAENYSMVMLEFDNGADLDTISVDIRDKIDQVSGSFADSVGKPAIYKMNPSMIPVTVAAVSRTGTDIPQLSSLVENELGRKLEGTDGVASMTESGTVDETIQVTLSQKKIDKANARLKSAVAGQYGSSESSIRKNISSIKSQQKQLTSSKKNVEAQQVQTAGMKASAGETLDSIKVLVTKRDELKAAGNTQMASSVQAQINSLKASLSPYRSALKKFGITISSVDKDTASASAAKAKLSAGCDTTLQKLSNSMSEITSGQSSLTSALSQLKSSLSQIGSSKSSALSATDLSGSLTKANIAQLLQAQNIDIPAGYVSDGGTDFMVNVGDKIKSVGDLKDLVIADSGISGVDPVKLGDVASVQYVNNGKDVYAKINGKDGILLTFNKQSDYATTTVADNIQTKFNKLESEYSGLKFDTLSDQGDYIHVVIDSVLNNILIGALLAILILMYFLKDWKPTLITALSIPISVTFAIVLMYFTGVTINVISLAGLAVGVGMLVDNSIVVIENIYRLRDLGYTKIKAAVSGAAQVAGAITASTLTTICVFIPIVFVEGLTRQIFVDMALTVSYSLLASLFIALTMVTMMGSVMLTKTKKNTVLRQGSRALNKYKAAVSWALDHKAVVISAAVALLVLSAGVLMTRGFTYMPSMATQQISVQITMPDDATRKETENACNEMNASIQKMTGVKTVGTMLSNTTSSLLGISAGQDDFRNVSMYIMMDDDHIKEAPSTARKIEKLGKKYNCEITATGEMDISSSSSAFGGGEISLYVYSDDLSDLRTSAVQVENKMSSIKGLKDVSDTNENSTPEMKVTINKNKAMKNGLTVSQVYAQISALLQKSVTATSIQYDGSARDVVIKGGEGSLITKQNLGNIKLTAGSGGSSNGASQSSASSSTKKVRLSDIADISETESLSQINRENQKRMINVTANTSNGYNITKMTDKVKSAVSKMDLPSSVSVEYSGQYDTIMDAMKQLLEMLLLGMLMIYLVMVAQFQSLLSPFIVMFSVPLAFTGGMIGLIIAGYEISVVSMIGFVMLQGIVVNNAIVLIDYVNQLRRSGMEKREALIEAGAARIRPVLMTALTTVLALIPLAIGIGNGSEMMQPVAVVCIGGLLYATIMTLIVIPVMYDILSRKKIRIISDEELTMTNA